MHLFGLSDEEIMDVVLAAAVRCFFSKTLDALGVRPDASFRELAPRPARRPGPGPSDRRGLSVRSGVPIRCTGKEIERALRARPDDCGCRGPACVGRGD
jgi:hypothetical protein